VILALLAASCARKAPGPHECEAAGARALGITHREQLQDPRARQLLDQFVVECLTTPFDRQLLRCIEETGRAQVCLLEFKRRHSDPRGGAEEPTLGPRRW
jgi:hypothetical protein